MPDTSTATSKRPGDRRPAFRESGETVSVRGWTSPPFFIFRGTLQSGRTPNTKNFSLLHQQDGRLIATLRTHAQARELASELAPVLLRGELPAPGPIVERYVRESVSSWRKSV